jgi:hypothetical protein
MLALSADPAGDGAGGGVITKGPSTMDERQIRGTMRAAVALATQHLSDDDLAGLNLVAQLEIDPRGRPWYPIVAHLFTEQGGTRMHHETRDALAAVALRRLA